MNDVANIGHNNPPADDVLLLELLQEKTSVLRTRYHELIEGATRIPAVCDDDEMAGRITDMIRLIKACRKTFETLREGEKEPYLTLGRTVDGYFKKFTETMDDTVRKATKPLDAYLKKKEDEKREALRQEAIRQREESERKAREAAELEAANMPQAAKEVMQEAVREADRAEKTEKQAEARPAELARTRADYGGLATLRTVWVGQIVEKSELDLNALRPFMSDDVLQKLVNAAVKAGFREIKGCKIFEQSSAQVK